MPGQGNVRRRVMSNRTQYPPIEPFDTGYLAVGDGHEIYYEQSGQSQRASPRCSCTAAPAAAATSTRGDFSIPRLPHRRVRSARLGAQPAACLARSQHDLAPRRRHGALARALSASTAGSYSAARGAARSRSRMRRRTRTAVSELVLRGIFLLRQLELTWFYQFGASLLFPEQWQEYLAPIPPAERHDLLGAFHRRLLSDDAARAARRRRARGRSGKARRARCCRIRSARTSSARRSSRSRSRASRRTISSTAASSRTRISCSTASTRSARIPAVIVHGRYDVVCPIDTAFELHRRWPEADFRIVRDAGHSAYEPGITAELVAATDRFWRQSVSDHALAAVG